MSENNCPPKKPTFAFDTSPDVYVPPVFCQGTMDYSTSACADSDANYVAGLMSQVLNAAGGPVNIFPMLGVYNQGSTIDHPGHGYPISSGTPSGYSIDDAFNVNPEGWQSVQHGAAVVSSPAYIGYDFGTKKAWTATATPSERYFEPQPVRQKVGTVKIKQGLNPANRATQIRVEASDDGIDWHRVDVVNLPSTDQMVSVGVRSSAAYNKWRLVPIFFGGVVTDASWEVVELHFLESTQLSLDSIEDYVLLENRDRAYITDSLMMKCTYDLLDVQSELAKFGINLPQTYIFTCSFADMVRILGRPVLVGDVIELPGEAQYNAHLQKVRKWLEVTDTGWSTEGYTANWKPNLFRFYAQPILPSVEHKDLLGIPGQVNAEQSDSDFLSIAMTQSDLANKASEVIRQTSLDLVPQDGQDSQDIQSGQPLIQPQGGYDGNDLYAQDAIPPNGEAYTFGDILPPPGTVSNGHYHRQTYESVPHSIRPPDRLLRWNSDRSRWQVVEVNMRETPQSHKKTAARIMSSDNSKPIDGGL